MQDGNEHVPFERLLAFVEGGLPPEAEADVQRHLDIGCDLCAREGALIRREITALQGGAWPAPSTSAHRRAVRAFRGLPTAIRPRPRGLRWTTALAGLAIIVLLAVVGLLNPLDGVASAASLAEVTGQVQVRSDKSAQWSVPSPGSHLLAGGEIRTGGKSHAVLVFPGGDRAVLSDSTSLTLEELTKRHGQWQIAFSQFSGATENYVQEGTSDYRVRTIAGEAVAAGTRFVVRMYEDGTVVVDVGQGSVTMIDPNGSSVHLSAGQTAVIPPPASTPVPASSSVSPPTSTPIPTSSSVLPSTSTPAPISSSISPSSITPTAGNDATEGDGENNNGDLDTGGGQDSGSGADQLDNPNETPTP